MLVIIILVSVLHGGASICSQEDERIYTQRNLEAECRSHLQLLQYGSPLKRGNDIGSSCTTECFGKYTNWLTDCGNTSKANLVRVSCLKNNATYPMAATRCRYALPDAAKMLILERVPQQCGSLTCSRDCSDTLNDLFNELGCCFQSVYNNSVTVSDLFKEGFLNQAQETLLRLFLTSGLLENCISRDVPIPGACEGEIFAHSVGERVIPVVKFSILIILIIIQYIY